MVAILTWYHSYSYATFIAVVIPSLEVAMALVPVLLIPFMVMGGFFVNTNTIPDFLKWIEYISMFKYGFQAAVINEYEDLPPIECEPVPGPDGQPVLPECDALKTFDFNENFEESLLALFIIGTAFKIFSFIGMKLIANPKRVKMQVKK